MSYHSIKEKNMLNIIMMLVAIAIIGFAIVGGRIYAPVDDNCYRNENDVETCESVRFEEDTLHPFMVDMNGNQ